MESGAFAIIVVILSVFLAIFLILSIIVLVKVIQVVNYIKAITKHAEEMADKASHVSDFFAKTAAPVAIAKLLSNVSEFIKNKSKSKDDKEG